MKGKAIAVRLECRLNDVSDLSGVSRAAIKMIRAGAKIGFADGPRGSGFNVKVVTPKRYNAKGFED